MHELAICQSLIDQVESIAQEKKANKVVLVVIAVGQLSGVEVALLRNAYPIASAGTVAENAELDIEEIPIRVKCTQCGCESDVTQNKLICKQCGDWKTELISGDEMILMSVELEAVENEAVEKNIGQDKQLQFEQDAGLKIH